jgi:hypothetical protein
MLKQMKQNQLMLSYNKKNRARYWNVTTRETEPDTGMLKQGNITRYWNVINRETEPDDGLLQEAKSQIVEYYNKGNTTRYWNGTTR